MRGDPLTAGHKHEPFESAIGAARMAALFMKELVSMPERHSVGFLIATILLILLEVEATEG